jgi:hypothetical protein
MKKETLQDSPFMATYQREEFLEHNFWICWVARISISNTFRI